jgi:hypothetical protein
MKSAINPRVGFAVAVGLILAGLLIIKPVLAQVASSTSDAATTTSVMDSTGSSTTTTDAATASSTTSLFNGFAETGVASSSATSTESNEPAAVVTPSEQAPQGLALVHIIGTKYTDYFTDGTTETSYPGDPKIDDHLAEPNADIPKHQGLTWVHTTGQNLYDTPSGDLDVGDYALQANGEYVENPPPFISSTSSPQTTPTQTTNGTASSTEFPSQGTTTSINTSVNSLQGSSSPSSTDHTEMPAGTSTDSL